MASILEYVVGIAAFLAILQFFGGQYILWKIFGFFLKIWVALLDWISGAEREEEVGLQAVDVVQIPAEEPVEPVEPAGSSSSSASESSSSETSEAQSKVHKTRVTPDCTDC